MIDYDYVCHTGKTLNNAEVDLYNRHHAEVERLETVNKNSKTGTLAWIEIESAKNRRHEIFTMISQ